MSCIFGIVNSFLRILSFNLIELDKSITVTFFFGWTNVEATHYDILTFLGNPSWQSLYTSFLKVTFFALNTG